MTRRSDLEMRDLWECDHEPEIAIAEHDDGDITLWRCRCGQFTTTTGTHGGRKRSMFIIDTSDSDRLTIERTKHGDVLVCREYWVESQNRWVVDCDSGISIDAELVGDLVAALLECRGDEKGGSDE